MPEYVLVIMVTTVLGWGSFTWRRAEYAADVAKKSFERTDKLELKLAEQYLTKMDFDAHMARLFVVLDRLEVKMDTRMTEHTFELKTIYSKLNNLDSRD
jgi:predicted transcriptional regulator of viral defense system